MQPIKPREDLYSQQIELEGVMVDLGVERFTTMTKKAQEMGVEERTTYGNALISGLITSVSNTLTAEVTERIEGGRAGRKNPALVYLHQHVEQMDMIAFIALNKVIASISKNSTKVSTLAPRIGRAVDDELFYTSLREKDRRLHTYITRLAKERSAEHVKRKVVNLMLRRREVENPNAISDLLATHIGSYLIEAIITSTDLIEVQEVIAGDGTRNTANMILPTEATRKFIADRTLSAALMRPAYEPMIVPPMDWVGPTKGGYISRSFRPLRLVKSRARGYQAAIAEVDMSRVLDAVNAAQQTAWAVNPFILSVLEVGWERGHSLGGIPIRENIELPPKPFDIDDNEEARIAWRKEARAVHEENRVIDSKRFSFVTMLQTAQKYSRFERIYMPYTLDFRGRIYAVPQFNPQGPDAMRALLRFAEGKPIDNDSAPFLAIHLANTGAFNKIDKAALEDRVAWVYENEDKIVACAEDPFENRWWTEADSPFCFLAACHEWAGWLREGPGFLSHIPVALDGSCSGLQHFSMAFADEIGGAAVNLVPSDKPADIYSLVMERVIAQAKIDAAGEGDEAEVAAQWLRSQLLIRSTFKRPTMTYGYGSGQYGFREQIEVDTLKPAHRDFLQGNGPWPFEEKGFKASLYLARETLKAVEGTVVKAAEAMAWLKEIAGLVASEGQTVRWTTPDGFPVVQAYYEVASKRIDTVIFGTRYQTQIPVDTTKVSKRQQVSAVSPNFIHSLDATHLRMAVLAAKEEGIDSFALVHDSFGTHAADTGRFFVILRETLARLYLDHDVVGDLHAEIASQLTPENAEQMPMPPSKGNLDLAAVVDCDFAFA